MIDVTTAFLQGKPIERDVYLRPPKEAMEDSDRVWKFLVTVYGLCDAQRAWYDTVEEFFSSIRGRRMLRGAAVFVWMEGQRLRGFISTHVDDFLWAGVGDFENTVVEPLRARFPIGEESHGTFSYVGTRIETRLDAEGNLLEIVMDHTDYVDELIPGEVDGSLK